MPKTWISMDLPTPVAQLAALGTVEPGSSRACSEAHLQAWLCSVAAEIQGGSNSGREPFDNRTPSNEGM